MILPISGSNKEQIMKFFKNRFALIVSGFVIIALIAGSAFYFQDSANAAKAEVPALQTAKVRKGDLVITASGIGTVVPISEVELGFRSPGMVSELTVALGDEVTSGEVLARLEENLQAESDFQALFTPNGLMQAQGDVAKAQNSLDDAITALTNLISPSVYSNELKMAEAQSQLDALKLNSTATQASIDEAVKNLERAQNNLKYAQNIYNGEYVPENFTYTWIDAETRETITEVVPPSSSDITLARGNVELARLAAQDAQSALEIVQAGPDALREPIAALGPKMEKLEKARLALEGTHLVAPFGGTITSLEVVVGQTVNTSPVMTIATTDNLIAHIYLDETDLEKAVVGTHVIITFDAYPNTPVEGEITLIEPALQSVGGSPVVAAWVSFTTPNFTILSGMNLEAEVIAGETHDALIIPKQALRELEPGVFAVFIVATDGQLLLTPVEVGLMDYANAEILSGLQVGDVVSTGNVETK
jgi:RND family efflux transporter MFP subunit